MSVWSCICSSLKNFILTSRERGIPGRMSMVKGKFCLFFFFQNNSGILFFFYRIILEYQNINPPTPRQIIPQYNKDQYPQNESECLRSPQGRGDFESSATEGKKKHMYIVVVIFVDLVVRDEGVCSNCFYYLSEV